MKKICAICQNELTGKQTKFCSLACKNSWTNNKHQNYVAQQKRGKRRRQLLIQLKGGCCEICGYNKNQAALSFHHLDASTKSFQIDIRKCSNGTWQRLLEEAQKCQLLCLNCHAEIHNPELSLRFSNIESAALTVELQGQNCSWNFN